MALPGSGAPVELWYPAGDEVHGRDLDPAHQDGYRLLPGFPPGVQAAVRDARPRPLPAGSAPLLVFAHGHGAHRRQSTFLCTHLASHGYVVAAPDLVGSTAADVLAAARRARSAGQAPALRGLEETARAHAGMLAQVPAALPALAPAPLRAGVAWDRVGALGHSLGAMAGALWAWQRPGVEALLLLAPARCAVLAAEVRHAAHRPASAVIAAAADSVVPLAGVRDLVAAAGGALRLHELAGADHMHFCDEARRQHELIRVLPGSFDGQISATMRPFDELAPAGVVHRAIGALALEQFAAALPCPR